MLLNPDWEKEALLDLSKPSLKALSHILRDKELWPTGFTWNYGRCDQCAMGMAVELWFKTKTLGVEEHIDLIIEQLDLEFEVAEVIFLNNPNGRLNMSLVTPEMVADEIDKCLM